ncbi:MAG: XrtA system polysaccharide deacetylase [Pseudomonadota bacterium]
MTVDVEDYFQVSAFEEAICRDSWDKLDLRVERNVDRILALFDEFGIKSTFFTLGWIAERCPGIVRRIVNEGHELASHGWEHVRVVNQSPGDFRADITRTKAFLEDLGGVAVNGYRAASYSIVASNLWAHDVLADVGYRYSSSIAPLRHDLYGMPEAPRFAFRVADGRLTEIPVTTVAIAWRPINCGGGGWFRLFPYALSRWALRRVNNHEGQSAHFYFHPWEIDPEQPRPLALSMKSRFRHYVNLSRTEARLRCLLADFVWDRMDSVFATQIMGEAPSLGDVTAAPASPSENVAVVRSRS